MKKFNDEQLSRILSAHAAGQLVREGDSWYEAPRKCCINQAAYRIAIPWNALQEHPAAALAFDKEYQPSWSISQFIQWLDKKDLL